MDLGLQIPLNTSCFIGAGGNPYDIIIPNFFVGNYEMDVFKLSKSGYLTEYEIKISRSDFFADFKKGKEYFNQDKLNKHDEIKNGNRKCNRFYFVVPENLITVDEVPDHCGLIYFDGRLLHEVKYGKFMHKVKHFEDSKSIKQLLLKLAFRDTLTQNKLRRIKILTPKP